MAKILITGIAGFIGYHLGRLLDSNHTVVGIDNMNTYYDIQLKKDRLENLEQNTNIRFIKMDLVDSATLKALFEKEAFDVVINLAAQAGVRYALENPEAYFQSNLIGFGNLLEACRHFPPKHLIYASSSSVYGANTKLPFSVEDNVDTPLSLYAATKKSNELMAHSYSHLYGIPMTGLRFFTVYGPWGRPDMALFKFTQSIFEDKPIQVYNHGKHRRDFTYIDDIVKGINALIDCPPKPIEDVMTHSKARACVYNIGNQNPVALMDFIQCIEHHVGKKAQLEFLPAQPGDMESTHADIKALQERTNFCPEVSLEEGVKRFVAWYKEYYL